MNWTAGLQHAIDYVEEHLDGELDFAEIARQAYSSSFHFQRVFGLVCGVTLGEYIRLRRLTQAGIELACEGGRVVDVALKYGYDSPESFARAFTRFHAVSPSAAKGGRAALKSFSRLSVKLSIEGGSIMDYRIEKQDAMTVIARTEHFGGEVGYDRIHALWNGCMEDGTMDALCRCLEPGSPWGDAIVGISYDSPDHGEFDYAVGAAYNGAPVPDGLSLVEIPAATWAVFPCAGPMPESFQALWKQIYTEFFPASDYQPQSSGGMFLEVYPGSDVDRKDFTCEFWVTVEKKR